MSDQSASGVAEAPTEALPGPSPVAAPSTPPAPAQPVLEGPVFTFRKRSEAEDPIVPFVFNGQQFHLHPRRVNTLVMFDLASINMESKPMWEFFEGVMADEYQRFRAAVRDPELIIEAAEMRALVEWMVEAAADRPT